MVKSWQTLGWEFKTSGQPHLHEKSKVVDIKAVIQEKANEKENWLPAYFTGGHYGNGLGVPQIFTD